MTQSDQPASRVKLSELLPVTIPHSPDWELRICHLYPIEPDEADQIVSDVAGCTVWHLCFTEDLLWMENASQNLVLDAGWHPECDAKGQYRLKLLRVISDDPNEPDWSREIGTLETRSFRDLIQRVIEIVNSTG